MTLLLTILMSFSAHADWFCTTQASKVYDTRVEACGVGLGSTESQARIDAHDQARIEFERLRPGVQAAEIPMRTECEKHDGAFRCYRMISFELPMSSQPVTLASLGSPDSIEQGTGYKQAFYSGPMCAGSSCYVIFENGKATKFVRFKASYGGL